MDRPRKKRILWGTSARKRILHETPMTFDLDRAPHSAVAVVYEGPLHSNMARHAPQHVKPLDAASQTYVQYMSPRDLCRVPLHMGKYHRSSVEGRDSGGGRDDDEHDQNKRFPGSSTRLANATTRCLALPQRDYMFFYLSLTDSSMMTATRTINQAASMNK